MFKNIKFFKISYHLPLFNTKLLYFIENYLKVEKTLFIFFVIDIESVRSKVQIRSKFGS